MKKNILIADEMHLSIHTMLTEIGMTYDYIPEITRAELLEKLKDDPSAVPLRAESEIKLSPAPATPPAPAPKPQ